MATREFIRVYLTLALTIAPFVLRGAASLAETGSGPAFSEPLYAAVEADGHLVVTDSFHERRNEDRVFRVHPVTGDRTLVSGDSRGSGPGIWTIMGIAVGIDGLLFVLDWGDGEISTLYSVDPVRGDRKVVSRNGGRGAGPEFSDPVSVVPGTDRYHVWVVNMNTGSGLMKVDVITGDRELIDTCHDDAYKSDAVSVALRPDGDFLLLANEVGADYVTGLYEGSPRKPLCYKLSGGRVGGGAEFTFASGVAVEPKGGIVVADALGKRLIRVNPSSGYRTVLSGPREHYKPVGSGPKFEQPLTIVRDADGHFVVVDPKLRALIRVHPRTGNRTVLSQGRGHSKITPKDQRRQSPLLGFREQRCKIQH